MSETDKRPRQVYLDYATEATKPISQRAAVINGRNGNIPLRNHHMKIAELEAHRKRAEAAGCFISPYKKYGAYDGAIEALVRLGENEPHRLGDVLKSFESYMSEEASRNKKGKTAWEQFDGRTPRSQKSALDSHGRFQQNLGVLQRLGGTHPYGMKLAQLGACIDILQGEKEETLIQIRTGIPRGDDVRPVNGFKKRNYQKSVESIPSGITVQEAVFSDEDK